MRHSAVKKVTPYVVKIQTPSGYGSGVMFTYNKKKGLVAIGTAAHVVEQADEWKQPIKIATESGDSSPAYLTDDDRVIFVDRERDSATILINSKHLEFPALPLPLIEMDKFFSTGNAVGWLGYPALYPSNLCFFRGYISAFLGSDDCY